MDDEITDNIFWFFIEACEKEPIFLKGFKDTELVEDIGVIGYKTDQFSIHFFLMNIICDGAKNKLEIIQKQIERHLKYMLLKENTPIHLGFGVNRLLLNFETSTIYVEFQWMNSDEDEWVFMELEVIGKMNETYILVKENDLINVTFAYYPELFPEHFKCVACRELLPYEGSKYCGYCSLNYEDDEKRTLVLDELRGINSDWVEGES